MPRHRNIDINKGRINFRTAASCFTIVGVIFFALFVVLGYVRGVSSLGIQKSIELSTLRTEKDIRILVNSTLTTEILINELVNTTLRIEDAILMFFNFTLLTQNIVIDNKYIDKIQFSNNNNTCLNIEYLFKYIYMQILSQISHKKIIQTIIVSYLNNKMINNKKIYNN